MAITYYMLQISPVLLFFLIVLSAVVLGGFTTYIFRKYIKIKILRSHNEVTGFLFLAIASFYALLLSFIVLVVWDQLNETRGNVSKEGSSATSLYRNIKFYPDTLASKRIMPVYLRYVANVIDEEFPNMEQMKLSRKTPESLDDLYYEIEHVEAKNPFQMQLLSEMFTHLNELSTYRGLRMTSMETEISPPLWLPIIFGALITLFCSLLLDIEHMRIHVTLNILLGTFIGMFLFIIILLDHPFSGTLAIKPKSYLKIFTMEKWESTQIKQIQLHEKK
jgi:hypothetical protein